MITLVQLQTYLGQDWFAVLVRSSPPLFSLFLEHGPSWLFMKSMGVPLFRTKTRRNFHSTLQRYLDQLLRLPALEALKYHTSFEKETGCGIEVFYVSNFDLPRLLVYQLTVTAKTTAKRTHFIFRKQPSDKTGFSASSCAHIGKCHEGEKRWYESIIPSRVFSSCCLYSRPFLPASPCLLSIHRLQEIVLCFSEVLAYLQNLANTLRRKTGLVFEASRNRQSCHSNTSNCQTWLVSVSYGNILCLTQFPISAASWSLEMANAPTILRSPLNGSLCLQVGS